MATAKSHIAIVGGGIIGLSLGWQLLRRGAGVTIFEREVAGHAASRVAAGMLAPYAESGFEELELMKLGRESLRMYPRFLNELAEDADGVPELDPCGTLLVGVDRDDAEQLRRLYRFRENLDLRVEYIGSTEAREREPLLSPKVISAIWLPDDAQIDNRALIQALRQAFLSLGGTLHEHTPVTRLEARSGRIQGLRTRAEGRNGDEAHEFDTVVVAAGCWSTGLKGIPNTENPAVRPLKGQILTLEQTHECTLRHMVRSPRVYLVPKEDGTIRLGATSEEKGFDTTPTAGAAKELLEDGWELVPSIYEVPLREITAGLRPASRDHAPVIGGSGVKGLHWATGHYRHGILYTPVNAYGLADIILDNKTPESLVAYSPDRFNEQSKPV